MIKPNGFIPEIYLELNIIKNKSSEKEDFVAMYLDLPIC